MIAGQQQQAWGWLRKTPVLAGPSFAISRNPEDVLTGFMKFDFKLQLIKNEEN